MKKWTEEAIINESKKYHSRTEWQKASKGSYVAAMRLGLLDLCIPSLRLAITKEECLKAALQYKYPSEWEKKDRRTYEGARKYKWLSECCKHMTRSPSPNKYWTEEKIKEESLKYSSMIEWQKKSSSSYSAAYKLNIKHLLKKTPLIHPNGYWTEEKIKEESLKYSSVSEWQKKSSSSYIASRRLGITNSCTFHMVRKVGVSVSELNILSFVQSYFPKAQKARFGKIIKGEYGNSFELDIYIPELRKGIEFNGDYWHSVEGLRRGRPNWPQEKLENYHRIKSEFFQQKNIEILTIEEKDWNENQEVCLNQIKSFLGIKNG